MVTRDSESPHPLRRADGSPFVSRRFIRSARAAAEAIFITPAGPPSAQRLDWLCLEIEDFVARAGPNARLLLRLALLAVSVLVPWMVLRLTTLRRLPLSERMRGLSRLEQTPLAAPVLALKALLCVLYYEHPDAAREVGFDGLCMKGPNS